MDDSKNLLLIGAATLLIIFGGIFLISKSQNKVSNNGSIVDIRIPESRLVTSNAIMLRESTESAKVKIVEFADFQCPACAFVVDPISRVLENYNEKEVAIYFRHFPLEQHKNAISSALSAEAAKSQGKFYEMYKILFEKQLEWQEINDPTELFVSYAQLLNLDINKFRQDLKSKEIESKIKKEYVEGISLGVDSTPTFFINGKKVPGALSFENFKQLIDEELAK